ncbi:C4-dicarboxylate transport transcriptional regulatory protein DctD [compost metagenome]
MRELQNATERSALGLELALDNNEVQGSVGTTVDMVSGGLSEQVENFEKTLIAAELARSHSSVRSVAEALGIPRKTLHDKLRKHGLSFADSGTSTHGDDLD